MMIKVIKRKMWERGELRRTQGLKMKMRKNNVIKRAPPTLTPTPKRMKGVDL